MAEVAGVEAIEDGHLGPPGFVLVESFKPLVRLHVLIEVLRDELLVDSLFDLSKHVHEFGGVVGAEGARPDRLDGSEQIATRLGSFALGKPRIDPVDRCPASRSARPRRGRG